MYHIATHNIGLGSYNDDFNEGPFNEGPFCERVLYTELTGLHCLGAES